MRDQKMLLLKLKKARKKILLKSNNFLHAIGEVALIVIGILVAFQVDNWREDLTNAKKVANYYSLIETDLPDFCCSS